MCLVHPSQRCQSIARRRVANGNAYYLTAISLSLRDVFLPRPGGPNQVCRDFVAACMRCMSNVICVLGAFLFAKPKVLNLKILIFGFRFFSRISLLSYCCASFNPIPFYLANPMIPYETFLSGQRKNATQQQLFALWQVDRSPLHRSVKAPDQWRDYSELPP